MRSSFVCKLDPKLWRTVEGVCNSYAKALSSLAKHQEPGLGPEARDALLQDKFQVLVAVQQLSPPDLPFTCLYKVWKTSKTYFDCFGRFKLINSIFR